LEFIGELVIISTFDVYLKTNLLHINSQQYHNFCWIREITMLCYLLL